MATMDGLPTVFEFWPFAPAGNFGIRKDVFGGIRGFNEDYRVCEDVGDLLANSHERTLAPFRARRRTRVPRALRVVDTRPSSPTRYVCGYPHLYRDFRRLGMTLYSVPGTLKYSLRRYVVGAPVSCCAPRPVGAGTGARGISWRAGCLAGSLKYRVPCL